MIFSIGNHVELIKQGHKTQTRRASDRYQIGKTYAVQPARTEKGIPEGRIMILKKKREAGYLPITREDALAEGGYTPAQFETLYDEIHPDWLQRWAYTFMFLPKLGDKRK